MSTRSDHDLLINIDANVECMKKWTQAHEIKDDNNFKDVMAKVNSLYGYRNWMAGGLAAFGFIIVIIVTIHK